MSFPVNADHIAPQDGGFEPQRQNLYDVEFYGVPGIGELSLSIANANLPGTSNDAIEIPFRNETRYVAGAARVDDFAISFRDYVDAQTHQAIMTWRRLVYDPANFVWGEKITDNVETCWPVMKPYVVHVHIKDWKLGSKDIGSIPGEGDGQIKELLAELAEMNYDGCLTMEPHLQTGGQFGGSTGPELFSRAIAAVREMAAEAGLKCS